MTTTQLTCSKCRTLIVRFKNKLHFSEIPFFRGAVIQTVSGNNILFHNHKGQGFRYAYPLIQYKRIGGNAAIVCIGEGTEAIVTFFGTSEHSISVGKRQIVLETEQVYANQTIVKVWDGTFLYKISNWMPLNQENYRQYMQYDSLADKYRMLERLLVGNILSFAKGVGIYIEQEINVAIISCGKPRALTYKGVKVIVFDMNFSTNVLLPNFIGLGKGVSHGFGTIHQA